MANSIIASVTDIASFISAVPKNLANQAGTIFDIAGRYNLSPWHLAIMMWRESNAGAALRGDGTGDCTPRPPGRKYPQPGGSVYVVGPSGMPEDGLCWGRGLMQIDYGVWHDWVVSNDWRDPATNIDKGAQILAASRDFFTRDPGPDITVDAWRLTTGMPQYNIQPWGAKYGLTSQGPYRDPRPLSGSLLDDAALAAHNAGPSGVLQAVAAGLPPEAATTGQDYVTWSKNLIAKWVANS